MGVRENKLMFASKGLKVAEVLEAYCVVFISSPKGLEYNFHVGKEIKISKSYRLLEYVTHW